MTTLPFIDVAVVDCDDRSVEILGSADKIVFPFDNAAAAANISIVFTIKILAGVVVSLSLCG